MGIFSSAYVVILRTVKFRLIQERGYIANFLSRLQGLELLQVFSGVRVAK